MTSLEHGSAAFLFFHADGFNDLMRYDFCLITFIYLENTQAVVIIRARLARAWCTDVSLRYAAIWRHVDDILADC